MDNLVDENAFGIASLPDDIVRRIIRVDRTSLAHIRLISQQWNLLVQEHCRQSKKAAIMRKVDISMEENESKLRVNAHFDDSLKYLFGDVFGNCCESSTLVYKTREVSIVPLPLMPTDGMTFFGLMGLLLLSILIPVMIQTEKLVIYCKSLSLLLLVTTSIAAYFYFTWRRMAKEVEARLTKLFGSISRIETLSLNRLYSQMLDTVRTSLGNVKVDQLTISGHHNCASELLLHLARAGGLRHVSTSNCSHCTENGIFTELKKLGVVVKLIDSVKS